jgi:hypothetical protein
MNKSQSNQFGMLISTQEYLDSHSPLWASVQRAVQYKNNLDEVIGRVQNKSQEVLAETAVTQRKMKLKEIIALKLSTLSGALQAYGHEAGNADLVKKVQVSKSDIIRSPEANLDPLAVSILGLARENLTGLADFGVTEALITETESSLNEFNGLIGKPRSILNSKYVAMDTVEQLLDEGRDLLKTRMDNIMLIFRDGNPEFYNGYQRARTIVDR